MAKAPSNSNCSAEIKTTKSADSRYVQKKWNTAEQMRSTNGMLHKAKSNVQIPMSRNQLNLFYSEMKKACQCEQDLAKALLLQLVEMAWIGYKAFILQSKSC